MTWSSRLVKLARTNQAKLRLRSVGINPNQLAINLYEAPGPDKTPVSIAQLSCLAPDTHELITFSGMSDQQPGIALDKALSEYLEARLFWRLGLDWQRGRSGFATAYTQDEARRRAYIELVERDAFLMHLMCPDLQTIRLPDIHVPIAMQAVKLQSMDRSIHVIMAAHKLGLNSPWILGLGAGDHQTEALKKAVLEVIMLTSSHRATDTKAPTATRRNCFEQHSRASLEQDVSSRLDLIFSGAGSDVCSEEVDPELAEVKAISKMNDGELVTVFLEHPNLLPLRFGQLWVQSEHEIQRLLLMRGLTPHSWVTHPLL